MCHGSSYNTVAIVARIPCEDSKAGQISVLCYLFL
jgi:hypothetical protein